MIMLGPRHGSELPALTGKLESLSPQVPRRAGTRQTNSP